MAETQAPVADAYALVLTHEEMAAVIAGLALLQTQAHLRATAARGTPIGEDHKRLRNRARKLMRRLQERIME
jgi:hypothetical protein